MSSRKICGASIYSRGIPGETYVCSLWEDHPRAHESADGAVWTQPEKEYPPGPCERCQGHVADGWSAVRPGEARCRWYHFVADCPALGASRV